MRTTTNSARSFGLRCADSPAQSVHVSEPTCRLSFKVVPGTSGDEVAGQHGDAIRVKLRAPPVDGRANAALLAFLAERLGLRASALHVVTGEKSRLKLVAIAGLSADDARHRLLAVP